MAKGKNINNNFIFADPLAIERTLIGKITLTGKEQLKLRRKAGLSSYYAEGGKIIEVFPDNTEREHQSVNSKWISLAKEKRTLVLK